MTNDLLTQLAEYGTYCNERQGAVSANDVTDAVMPLPMSTQPTRPRNGWLIAAAAAVLVLLLVGGLGLLAQRNDPPNDAPVVDQVEPETPPVIDPPATTLPLNTTEPPPTTLPVEVDIDGFAPSLSGLGVEAGEWNSLTLGSREFAVGASTFTVWEGTLRIDWRGVAKTVVDDNTRFLIENPQGSDGEVGIEWIHEEGILDFFWWGSKESFAQLALDFTGTGNAWVVEVSDGATGVSLGSIEGSLPGLQQDEIFAHVIGGPNRIGWFFVSDGRDTVSVEPSWASHFEEGGSRLIVAGETIFAFMVTDGDGPGQMAIWSSTDGKEWEGLGSAPWSGRIYALDTLVEQDGELLALVYNSGERPSSEEEGTVHYWSSGDGVIWVELSEAEWAEKSGGIELTHESGPVLDPSIMDYFGTVALSGTMIPDDLVVIQPALGPEPQFDTSILGREISLEPAAPGVTVVDRLLAGPDLEEDRLSIPNEPILYIGRIEEPFASDFLIWTDGMYGFCESLDDYGTSCESPAELDPDNPIRHSGQPDLVVVFVPLDAAAVGLKLDNGEPMWQRPIGGWALLPGPFNETTRFTLTIYDEAGTVIGNHSR
jgi:hypothetical protein